MCFPGVPRLARSRKISLNELKTGRRVVELDILVRGISSCSKNWTALHNRATDQGRNEASYFVKII